MPNLFDLGLRLGGETFLLVGYQLDLVGASLFFVFFLTFAFYLVPVRNSFIRADMLERALQKFNIGSKVVLI